MNLLLGTREYKRQYNHRNPIVVDEVLKIVLHITKF